MNTCTIDKCELKKEYIMHTCALEKEQRDLLFFPRTSTRPSWRPRGRRETPAREALEEQVAAGVLVYDGETVLRVRHRVGGRLVRLPSPRSVVALDGRSRAIVTFTDGHGRHRRVGALAAAWWFVCGEWPRTRWSVVPFDGRLLNLAGSNLVLLSPGDASAYRRGLKMLVKP